MSTLEEHDPAKEPLLILPCDHVFTMTTLDGVAKLESVYSSDPNSGEWSGLLPLPAQCGAIPQCPNCRTPIVNVRRYHIREWGGGGEAK